RRQRKNGRSDDSEHPSLRGLCTTPERSAGPAVKNHSAGASSTGASSRGAASSAGASSDMSSAGASSRGAISSAGASVAGVSVPSADSAGGAPLLQATE